LDMNTPSMNKNILVIGVSTNSGTIHGGHQTYKHNRIPKAGKHYPLARPT
jgi:hypothetical protein